MIGVITRNHDARLRAGFLHRVVNDCWWHLAEINYILAAGQQSLDDCCSDSRTAGSRVISHHKGLNIAVMSDDRDGTCHFANDGISQFCQLPGPEYSLR